MGFSNCRKVVVISLLFPVFTYLSVASASSEPQRHRKVLLLEDADIEDEQGEAVVVPTKKTTTTISSLPTTSGFTKNKTKLLKSSSSSSSYDSTDSKPTKSSSNASKNQTKLIKPVSSSLKNKTKVVKSESSLLSKAEGDGYSLEKTKLKKLNSTSKIKTVKSAADSSSSKSESDDGFSLGESKLKKPNFTSKALSSSDSTKFSSISTKKTSDLLKSSSSTKIKTSKFNADEETQPAADKINKKKEISNEINITDKKKSSSTSTTTVTLPKSNSDQNQNQKKKPHTSNSKTLSPLNRLYNSDEDDDLVSEFRELPTKFQKTFIPDLQRISTSSQIYFSKANKEITRNFKPYVGNKYASPAATAISCAFIIIPFLLVSLLFNRIKAFFSLKKLLIFIQVYLAIYFTILCLSSLVTGLEPLKFFYATSRSTYVWLQVLQTLGYVLYLLLLLMYLILVFSTTESGLGLKFLGLAQTLVGFAVGLHYYMTVFHRVVLHQPPKTNWKVHAVYATCFLVICLLAGADRRKKAYRSEGGEEGKKS